MSSYTNVELRSFMFAHSTFSILVTLLPLFARADDWPQFQQNAQRHGRAAAAPAGPYRARWIWCGPESTLRNKAASGAGVAPAIAANWPDDLTGRDNYSFPMPKSVPMTFAEGMQPVHSAGILYALDQEGRAYAIDIKDGATKWIGANPGGSLNSPVIAADLLIAASITGRVTALKTGDGKEAWAIDTHRAITGSPALVDQTLYVGNHAGEVYSIDAPTGKVNWKIRLPAPCVGGIAADASGCDLGAEDKRFYALNARDGSIRAKATLVSQGFRLLWPMIHEGKIYVQVVGVVCAGSEHVFDDVLQSGSSPAEENKNIRRWLAGDDNKGAWKWASPDMKHIHVLESATLAESFIIPNGPSEGCGIPADPPVVDNQNRVLLWFRTKFPTFTRKDASFGTRFTLDISAVDPLTGDRIPIDNGRMTNQGAETDNAFAFSIGGDILFMRQRFRGTHAMDLKSSTHHLIEVESRQRDGGHWDAPISYVASGNVGIQTPQPAAAMRTAPSISADAIFFAERYCITCAESAKPAK